LVETGMPNAGLEELGIVDDLDDGEPAQKAEKAQKGGKAESGKGPVASSGEINVPADEPGDTLIELLRQISLFDGLLPVHLQRIAYLVQEVNYGAGEAVFKHGDEGDGLYLILAGAVRISRTVSGMGEEALAVLRPGMYFGEMSIVDDDVPRSADAIAHERSRLLKLPKEDLRDLMFVDRELAYELLWRFVRTLSARLRDSNDRLLMLTVSSKF
jgi:CRP/FNR family cyclic AMP-dependent transcriptional regulator